MTLRLKRGKLWIVQFSFLELLVYILIVGIQWVFELPLPWWALALLGLGCVLHAIHPVSIEPGSRPAIRRYFGPIPLRRIEVADLAIGLSSDDFGDGRHESLTVGGEEIPCDRPNDVAEWIRSNTFAR